MISSKAWLDSLGGSTAANIEEVSGRTTVELDDVHGGHGETGTVDNMLNREISINQGRLTEAANVSVELDEVEAVPWQP